MKKGFIIGLTILLITGMTGVAGATDITARAFGMGGAFTGVANDMTSVIYNPAGLSQSGFVGLQLNSGFRFPDISETEDLLEIPDKMGDDNYSERDLIELVPEKLNLGGQLFLGANFKSLALAVNSYTDMDFSSDGNNEARVDSLVTTEGIVTFSSKIISPPFDIGELSLGANLKMIRSDEVIYSVKANLPSGELSEIVADGTGYGLDVGVLAKITPLVTIGARVKNLWASKYNLEGTRTFSEYNGSWQETAKVTYSREVDPERVMRIGASVYVPLLKATLAADIDNFPLLTEGDRDQVFHLGVEKNLLFNGISLRAGTYKPTEEDRYYTLGLGLNLWKLHLDTAVASNDSFKDNLNFVLSANMKF